MRILLIGVTGQLGWELLRALQPLGAVTGTARGGSWPGLDVRSLDLGDPDAIRRTIRETRPELIINAAAYTAVDQAEDEEQAAWAINGEAPGVLAEEAKGAGAALVHYSTDYVFDGKQRTPYRESDAPAPLNAYGRTKLAGERAIEATGVPHLILRAGWVYAARGRNFLRTVLRLARERPELSVVDDQVGTPTWSRLLAEATAQILARIAPPGSAMRDSLADCSGVYHLSSGEAVSWYAFAQAILEHARTMGECPPCKLRPIPTSGYPTRAARPPYSVLSSEKLRAAFDLALPNWQTALSLCLSECRDPIRLGDGAVAPGGEKASQ